MRNACFACLGVCRRLFRAQSPTSTRSRNCFFAFALASCVVSLGPPTMSSGCFRSTLVIKFNPFGNSMLLLGFCSLPVMFTKRIAPVSFDANQSFRTAWAYLHSRSCLRNVLLCLFFKSFIFACIRGSTISYASSNSLVPGKPKAICPARKIAAL